MLTVIKSFLPHGRSGLFFILFAISPALAHANGGTPLVMAELFHLFLGNAVLGVIEGMLLARFFRLSPLRCVLLLIAANYASAWGGWSLLAFLQNSWRIDLYNGLRFFWISVLVLYLLTLSFEAPFIAWCFRKRAGWLKQTLLATLAIQSLSYLVLFAIYWPLSVVSLYRDVKILPTGQVALPDHVMLYYISDADGDVYCQSAGSQALRICDLNSSSEHEWLKLKGSKADPERFDLVTMIGESDEGNTILPGVAKASADLTSWAGEIDSFDDRAARIGLAEKSQWRFSGSTWPDAGLYGRHESTKERIHLAFGTPVFGWPVYRTFHLPEEKVLFQLGSNQICILDVATKRLSLLAYGRGAIALSVDALVDEESGG